MKAEKLLFLENTILVIPKFGFAPMLFLEHLKTFNELDPNSRIYPIMLTDPNILRKVGEVKFCIELTGPNLNVPNHFIYDLFVQFINTNLSHFRLGDDF
jgi:hypothetical protein